MTTPRQKLYEGPRNAVPIADIPGQSDATFVRISLGRSYGRPALFFREWQTKKNGRAVPIAARGFAILLRNIDALGDALENASREARERGLSPAMFEGLDYERVNLPPLSPSEHRKELGAIRERVRADA